MALHITFSYNVTGRTVSATIERLSDGYYWNPGAGAFQSAPSYANKKNALTEGSSENLYSYTASIGSLGSPGRVRLRVHDESASNQVVGISDTWVINNDEVTFDDTSLTELSSLPSSPALYQMITAVFQRLFYRHKYDVSGGNITLYKADGTTPLATQTVTETAGVLQDVAKAS